MKYCILTLSAVLLVACGGTENRQVLPPELQGNPLGNTLPPVSTDPLSEFPLETTESVTEVESETVESAETVEVAEPNVTVAANCEALTQDLETSFADMNFCDTNEDCAVAAGSCPFGCYLFHNAEIDFADYQPALTAYQESCNP